LYFGLLSFMFPVFGDDRKRKINLGGASSASSRSAILDQAQVRRNERVEQKRRQDNAVKLQAWWRGLQEGRQMMDEMRKAFEADVVGMTGLRCLVLIGRSDEEALAIWSGRMMESGAGAFVHDEIIVESLQPWLDTLFEPARSGDSQLQNSWLVLIRQTCFLLLRSVSKAPL
jgi:ubiquitin-protein ligase E3 C